jgi:hypothetical protein
MEADGELDGVACTTMGAGVAACRCTTTVFVWLRTIGFPATADVCSDAALAVGPVMPSENAAPAIASTPTSDAAISIAERLFIGASYLPGSS